MNFIYSTLSNDNIYCFYKEVGGDLPVIEKKILIKGKANVADKNLVTPKGVITKVSDEDLKMLEKDYNFKLHCQNGFITIEKKQIDVDKAIKDMERKDQSAPKDEQFFVELNLPKPVVVEGPSDFEPEEKHKEKKNPRNNKKLGNNK